MTDNQESAVDRSDGSIKVEWGAPVEEKDYQIRTDTRLENYDADGSVELQEEIGTKEEVVEVPAKPSIANAIYNLLNYIVGAGILGLPYAFRQSGVLLGLLLLIFVGLATVYSFYLLLWSSDISKQYSYESLARHGMGNKASTAVKCIIIIDSFGTLSAYLIVVADAARVFFAIFLEEGHPLLDKRVLILLSLVLILPLSLLRKIEALGFTSLLSLLPLGFLLLLQIIFLGTLGVGEGVAMFKSSFFLALPIFVFAFSSQQAFFPIYNELKEKSGEHRDMNRVVLISVSITIFSYFTSGLFGVLVFPTTATDQATF
jgi:amino acid permease